MVAATLVALLENNEIIQNHLRGENALKGRTGSNGALGFLLGLMAIMAAAAPAAADASWDEVVKAAKAEGEVDVHGGPGRVYGEVLTEGFQKAYPDIKLNFSGSSGRDAIPQIMREREAGVYHWDVYVGGTPSILRR